MRTLSTITLPIIALFFLLSGETGCKKNSPPGAGRSDLVVVEGPALKAPSGLEVVRMKINVSEQQEQGFLTARSAARKPHRALRGDMLLLQEDFESQLNPRTWEALSGPGRHWKRSNERFRHGSFSLKIGGVEGDGLAANQWLIAGPFDLTQVSHAGFHFQMSLQGASGGSTFFWGASTNDDEFFGYSASGDSHGWQMVNFSLEDFPELSVTTEKRQVWVGLFYEGGKAGKNAVFVDDLEVYVDAGLSQVRESGPAGQDVVDFSGGSGLARPTFADLDGDGDTDLFVGGYDGTVKYFENKGSSRQPAWRLAKTALGDIDVGENSAPAFCDIDLDGDLDLFVGNRVGRIAFYLNVGSASAPLWEDHGWLRTESGRPIDVNESATPTFFDIDGDGDEDLLVGDDFGYLGLYLNESKLPHLSWKREAEKYLGVDVGSLSSPTAADLDGDGDPDVLCGMEKADVLFYENEQAPLKTRFKLKSKSFVTVPGEGTITSPSLVDYDGDRRYDLCVGLSDGSLHFYRNTGTTEKPNFEPDQRKLIVRPGFDVGFQSAPVLADLDGDGDLDFAVGAADGTLTFLENTGTANRPAWSEKADVFAGVSVRKWSSPSFVDIDSDGDLDLFLGSRLGKIAFYQNDGSKQQPVWRLISDNYEELKPGEMTSPTFADLDDDGDFDLFVGTQVKGIAYYENRGNPQRPSWRLIADNYLNLKNIYRLRPVFVDWDLDGDLDLLAGTHEGTVLFSENVGFRNAPNFQFVTPKLGGIDVRFFSSPAAGDIDGDGDVDLFLGNNSGGLYFWRNFLSDPSFVGRR